MPGEQHAWHLDPIKEGPVVCWSLGSSATFVFSGIAYDVEHGGLVEWDYDTHAILAVLPARFFLRSLFVVRLAPSPHPLVAMQRLEEAYGFKATAISRQTAQEALDTIKQGPTESWGEFYPRFERAVTDFVTMGGAVTDEYFLNMLERASRTRTPAPSSSSAGPWRQVTSSIRVPHPYPVQRWRACRRRSPRRTPCSQR